MEHVMFRTAADGGAVLSTIGSALASMGYSVKPYPDGWSGRAEVGSAAARFLLGGFSRRMIVEYRLTQGDQPGSTHAVITPAMTGLSGGAIGYSKAKQEMQNIHQTVGAALFQAGLLAN